MNNRPDWVFLVSCPWFVLDPIDGVRHDNDVDAIGTTSSPTLDWRGWLDLWADQHAATGSEAYAEQHRHRGAKKTAAINTVFARVYPRDTGKSVQKPSRGLNDSADDVDSDSHTPNPETLRDSTTTQWRVVTQGRLDRIVQGASPPPHGDREQRYGFESCIAHLDANERLLWHASQMLAAAAEIAARLPKGSASEQQHDQFKEPS